MSKNANRYKMLSEQRSKSVMPPPVNMELINSLLKPNNAPKNSKLTDAVLNSLQFQDKKHPIASALVNGLINTEQKREPKQS